MDHKINQLISRINQLVEQEVTEYIDERIEILLQDMSCKHGLSYENLLEDYRKSRNTNKRKCTMITTLGHTCKYDAKPNEKICKKHYNKAHHVK
jgi:hypothetical protein